MTVDPNRRAPQRPHSAAAPQPPKRRPGPPPRRSSGLGNAVFWMGLGAAALIAGGIAFLLVFAPADIIRDRVIAEVKARTGRDLVIAGPASMTVYPAFGVTLSDVSLSAPPGMGGAPTVKMAGLEVSVAAWPLLSKQVVVERLVLRQPVFDLRVDRTGRRSWDIAAAEAIGPHRVRLAQATTGSSATRELRDFARGSTPQGGEAAGVQVVAMLGGLDDLSLGDVRIEGGRVDYSDERSGVREQVSAIDMKIGLSGLSKPLSADGKLTYKAEPFTIAAKLATPAVMLSGSAAKVDIKVAGRPVSAAFDGALVTAQRATADGSLLVTAPSLAGLVRYLGSAMPDAPGVGPLKLTGKLKAGGTRIALADTNLTLDGTTATGAVAAELAGARPAITADLKISEIDLNKYLAVASATVQAQAQALSQAKSRPAAPAPAPAAGKAPAAPGAAPGTIGDLIERQGGGAAKVKGFTQRAGWSEEGFNLAALGAVDVDAKLAVGRILVEALKIGQSRTTIALKSQQLRVTVLEMQLYEGRGTGVITLDATTPTVAAVGANISVDGISAQPLLMDAADLDWITGKGKVVVAVAGRGVSQKQVMEGLGGKADFAFADGAIVGFNIPQMIRGLSQGRIGSFEKVATEKTDFSELSATFAIANGVARNQDLKMVSPLLRVGGAGAVDVGQRSLDYTVKPKLVGSLQGQGGAGALGGLEIPVRLKGPWEKIAVEPDIEGLLKDPGKVVDAVKDVVKELKGKDGAAAAGKIIEQFQGKDGAAKAGKLIEQLLKR